MSTETRISNLEKGLNAIMTHLGVSTDEPQAKTSARIRPNDRDTAEFAASKKSKLQDDVEIVMTPAMIDGRMKLPARMFTKGTKCLVDGHTFSQQAADQNRSGKFDPAIFGDVGVNDTITFEHLGGREWTATVTAGSRRGKKSAAKNKVTLAKKKAPAEKPEREVFVVPESARKNSKSLVSFFADVAIDNANDKNFEENPNIKASMQSAGRKVDARIYLTTAQQQKFRKYRKALGLGYAKSIELLNAAVFE